MKTKIKVELSDIQKTLFMPVWERAVESKKENPLLTDETANRKFIPGSFLDSGWFSQIRIPDKVLFISTGVFVYFEEDVVRNFILQVADRFDDPELFFDVTSPKGVEIANQVIQKSGLDSGSFSNGD